jgi:hypothetical protein
VLDSFTFYVDLPTSTIFRDEVYAWDSSTGNPAHNTAGNATGPALYESGPTSIPSYGNGFTPQQITFTIPGGLALTANTQYVLFITTSRDNGPLNPPGTAGFGGYVPTGTTGEYSGGDFVWIVDNGDPTQWTNPLNPWSQFKAFGQDDLAFQATFSSPPPPLPTTKTQCMNGGWKTYGFMNQGQCISFVNTGKPLPGGP